MLEDAAHQNFEHIVSWVDGGQRFRIHNPQALTEILGQYFNQTNNNQMPCESKLETLLVESDKFLPPSPSVVRRRGHS